MSKSLIFGTRKRRQTRPVSSPASKCCFVVASPILSKESTSTHLLHHHQQGEYSKMSIKTDSPTSQKDVEMGSTSAAQQHQQQQQQQHSQASNDSHVNGSHATSPRVRHHESVHTLSPIKTPTSMANGSSSHQPETPTPNSNSNTNNTSKVARKAVSACLLYSFCSVSMVLTNKSLASSYNHLIDGDLNILLVVFQAVVAVACVEICKCMKWVEYPDFNLRTARLWAPVNLLFCAMLFTGMASLQYNSVPMVTIFKNVTNIFVTAGDYYCFGQVPETLVILAFGVMLGGAVAAAWNDISVTSEGLFWMAANCVSTAGYVLYLKFATQTVKLSKFGMVFYNNVLCTFFLLPAAISMGNVSTFLKTPALHTTDYWFKNLFAGCVGFFLNFASLTCVSVTGPTTYAIVGSLNKVPVAILGYILFDNAISQETWFFISVSMAGGFLYSYAKVQSSRTKAMLKSHVSDVK